MQPLEILKKYWGYSQFRPKQEDIISNIISQKDTLALLPTGGGKSICFQIPALALDGLCIVISPLIALMKDQVENLKKRNIVAAAIYSGMSKREIDITLDNAIYGKIKLLYVSPERLKTTLFIERAKQMKISFLAIDEAHCISQWGYDFRPSYLDIVEFKETLNISTTLALTATATEEVAKDITKKLNFKEENVIQNSFERSNLAYKIVLTENKLNELVSYVQNNEGSGVLYLRSRMRTKEVSSLLSNYGISTDFYHAGLSSKERSRKQEEWMSNKTRVICSTNAFGMGIDKSDVRFVLHLDVPDTLEAYFQEAGRAGRDLLYSEAVAFLNKGDVKELEKRVVSSFPELETVRKVYQAICNSLRLARGSGQLETFDINLIQVAEKAKTNLSTVHHSLKILELNGYISLSESVFSPSSIKIELTGEVIRTQTQLVSKRSELLINLLRNHNGILENQINIKEEQIAKQLKISIKETTSILKQLAREESITYLPRSGNPKLTFEQPVVPITQLTFHPETYIKRKNRAIDKMDAISTFTLQTETCRSILLLKYFGEKSDTNCGLCDVCIKNKTLSNSTEYKATITAIKANLSEKSMGLAELLRAVKSNHDRETCIFLIQWMLDNKMLVKTKDNQLCVS